MARALLVALLPVALALALSAAAPPASAAGNRTVLHYGDSLAVGTELFLDRLLPGWTVRARAEISVHADGVPRALRAFGPSLPRVVVVSAGTNDDPSAVSRFARVVRQVAVLAGPRRCVVWSTIVRPPYGGVSYAGYNRALRAAARSHANLRILDWAAMARAHPGWFGADGVHPSMQGYRARAAATARLIKSC